MTKVWISAGIKNWWPYRNCGACISAITLIKASRHRVRVHPIVETPPNKVTEFPRTSIRHYVTRVTSCSRSTSGVSVSSSVSGSVSLRAARNRSAWGTVACPALSWVTRYARNASCKQSPRPADQSDGRTAASQSNGRTSRHINIKTATVRLSTFKPTLAAMRVIIYTAAVNGRAGCYTAIIGTMKRHRWTSRRSPFINATL